MREREYEFSAAEQPLLPGGPYLPRHPAWRRGVYAGLALLASITATLGNALTLTNVSSLAGSLGEFTPVIALLPAVFVAMNATGNLSLVKSRIRWGIPQVTQTVVGLYAIAALLELFFPTLVLAVVACALAGLSAAALTAASIFYLLQIFPPTKRPKALATALGLTQLGIPLARLFPVEVLAQEHWRVLHLVELAVTLSTLAAMQAFPLPPSNRGKAFEPLDFATIGLLVPAMLLLAAVLGVGRLHWWTDTPWLGWALVAAVPLFASAILLEYHRARPLLQIKWLGTADILRFGGVALLVRLALAEQTYGSVGLLQTAGLNNEQLRLLFGLVLGAMALGLATAILTIRATTVRFLVIGAALIVAAGAWLDSHATSVTRPAQLYLSQSLIGFGTTLFIGPALAFGFLKMLQRGTDHFVTLVVLFSTTQNVGGLAGAALLGSYQQASARAYVGALAENVMAANPQVIARLQQGAQLAAGSTADPAQQAALGGALLFQSQAREAAVLAYNDVFRLVMVLAVGAALFVASVALRDAWRAHRRASSGSSS